MTEDALSGEVLPFSLGQSGLQVNGTDGAMWRISSGVVGQRVALAPIAGRAGWARVVRVLSATSSQVDAPCPIVDDCGGCALQATDYGVQLELKRQALEKLAASLTDENVPVSVVGLQSPFGYRTRLLMPASSVDGKLQFGFYRRQSLDLIAGQHCAVQHPITIAALDKLCAVFCEIGVKASDVEGGWLHAVAIRCNPAEGSWDLVLMANTSRPALAKRLSDLPGLIGVSQIVYRKRTSYPFSGHPQQVWATRKFAVPLAKASFELSPASFFQTSLAGAELLAQTVREFCPERIGKLADLYGGVGVFSRLLAARWDEALLVESNADSVADLAQAEIANLRYLEGAVENEMEAVASFRPDVVLLDPPRKGVKESALRRLVTTGAERIVYVACGADALERDLRILIAGGYRLAALRGVDMFPHTTHLEIVALLHHCK